MAFLLMAGLAGPVQAASAPKPAAGSNVDMPFLIAPMAIDDKLVAYAYITSAVVATTPTAAIEVRDKLAFIQDAYVRDVNATPISKPDDPKTVDVPGLAARFTADAKRIVGADKVSSVTILVIKFAPLKGNGQTDTPPGPS
jgi:hypothetical protein